MSPEQIEELKADLEALKTALAQQIDQSAASAAPVELDQAAIGRVTRMDAIQQQSLAKASREALKIRLSQADRALRAIQEGDYGLCRRCDEEIAYRRLKAKPEAPFCVRCAR